MRIPFSCVKFRWHINEYGVCQRFFLCPVRPGHDSCYRNLTLELSRAVFGVTIDRRLSEHNFSSIIHVESQSVTKSKRFCEHADFILDTGDNALHDMPDLISGERIIRPASKNSPEFTPFCSARQKSKFLIFQLLHLLGHKKSAHDRQTEIMCALRASIHLSISNLILEGERRSSRRRRMQNL